MKRLLAIILITIGHAVITGALFLSYFMLGSSRFDTGVSATIGERFLGVVTKVLMWPLFEPLTYWGGKWANRIFPGFLGYIPFFINSLLWAIVIVWIWCKLKNKTLNGSNQTKNKF